MKQRLFFGSASLFIALIAITLSHHPLFSPIFALLFAALIATAVFEYLQFATTDERQPLKKLGVFSAALYALAIYCSIIDKRAHLLPSIVLWGVLLASFIHSFFSSRRPLASISLTLFGLFWLAFPLSYMLEINYLFQSDDVQDGRFWLTYLIAIKIANDGGALFAGTLLGNHTLAAKISPKKTWEGAFGGLVCSLFTSVLFWQFSPNPVAIVLPWIDSLILGGLLSLLAQIGDLAESLIKRDVGVKDSSSLPGVGGVLDLVDSLVFTAPFLWFYLTIGRGS